MFALIVKNMKVNIVDVLASSTKDDQHEVDLNDSFKTLYKY